jgi:VanZ family protein
VLLVRAFPVAVWATLIFVLSSFSNPPGQTGAEWWAQAGHFGEYLVLGLLLARFLATAGRRWPAALVMFGAWLAASLYGASDEWHQSFVPGRDANLVDVYTDSAGAFVGVLLWRFGPGRLRASLRRWQLARRAG